jgi:hypothetical protein
MMGSSSKVSLHATGQAQFSMSSDWYGANVPNQPNQRRHFDKWSWRRPTGLSSQHVFTLSIPQSELRFAPSAENLSKVRWLPYPGEGYRVDLDCFVAPVAWSPTASQRPDFVASLNLDPEYDFVLLHKIEDMTASHLSTLESARRAMQMAAKASGVQVHSGARGAALFHYDATGVFGMFEIIVVD